MHLWPPGKRVKLEREREGAKVLGRTLPIRATEAVLATFREGIPEIEWDGGVMRLTDVYQRIPKPRTQRKPDAGSRMRRE